MDWNILRRTPLILLFFSTHLLFATSRTASLPRQIIRTGFNTEKVDETGPLQPRQNHSTTKAWSYDVESLIAEYPEISHWIQRWTSPEGLKKYTTAMDRSRLFHHEVMSRIRAATLPPEVASIPVVESNWRLNAVSSSAAAGPWQFLESSARGRQLLIDVWHDERRDPWRATDAAVKELSFYRRLQGDWLLAIASYNAGPTRIRKIREASGLNDFWSLLRAGVLPPETRDYIPQIIAVAYLAAHEGRLGIEPDWEEPPEWEQIPLTRSILLSDMAQVAGMDIQTARQLHPELNFPVTPPPGSGYQIKVPAKNVQVVKEWLENLESSSAPLRFWRYTVKSGDTISTLIRKTGVSFEELLHYNAQMERRGLRAGERILLPGNTLIPEGSEPDQLPNWPDRYRVVNGDSLWSIARRFGVSPETLAEANHRSLDGVLLSGSLLRVPGTKVD